MKRNNLIVLALCASLQISLARPPGGNNGGGGSGDGSSAPLVGNITVAPPAGGSSTSTTTTGVDGATSSSLDYLFNKKAEQGSTAQFGGQLGSALLDKIKAMDALKTPGGMDDPVVRARFNIYLNLEQVPQARIDAYFAKVNEVSELLKAGMGGQDNIVAAYKDLYELSKYQDLDGGVSAELAHQIEKVWGVDNSNNNIEKKNADLRHDVDVSTHNSDVLATDLKNTEFDDQQKKQTMANSGKGKAAQKGGQSSNSNSGSGSSSSTTNIPDPSDSMTAVGAMMPTMGESMQGKAEMFDEFEKNATARAKIWLNERRENMENDAIRTDFADYITTLYDSHRYYQVIMAAAFYQNFFPDGDVPQDLANQAASAAGTHGNVLATSGQQMGKRFLGMNSAAPLNAVSQLGARYGGQKPGADKPLTIPDMVTAALQVNGQVDDAVKAFNYNEGKSQVSAAAEELQEAFVGNEYHPALKGLPRDQKEMVGSFLAKLAVLKSQLENRAYELVDDQVAQIKKIANDFDATEPLTMSHTAQVQSMFLLGRAQMAAQKGDDKAASDAMADAMEVWPTNPKLVTSGTKYFDANNEGNELTDDFDRLVKAEDYRAIYDKALMFGPAVKDDTARVQQLKDAVEKVKKAEIASEKANMQVINGDVNGAWETIELAVKDWPDDMKLNKLLADLSGRSADFVSALNRARDAETKKEYGYSLTWYVNAQNDYPASQLANDGIDRISKQILAPPADSPAPSSSAQVN